MNLTNSTQQNVEQSPLPSSTVLGQSKDMCSTTIGLRHRTPISTGETLDPSSNGNENRKRNGNRKEKEREKSRRNRKNGERKVIHAMERKRRIATPTPTPNQPQHNTNPRYEKSNYLAGMKIKGGFIALACNEKPSRTQEGSAEETARICVQCSAKHCI